MNNQGGFPVHKGARWIVDQIAAAFESSGGRPASSVQPRSRPDVDDLVGQALDEELDRLDDEGEA